KKRCARRGQNARTDPLVDPGNPAHREPHGPASDPGNSNHRLVNLEKSPSSRSKAHAYAPQNATVMLGPAGSLPQAGCPIRIRSIELDIAFIAIGLQEAAGLAVLDPRCSR